MSFAKSHPVLSYYLMVFGISWGGILLIAGGQIPGTPEQVGSLFPLALLMLFAGPFVSGIVMNGLTGGKAGLKDLFSRMRRWRAAGRWYALAILFSPLLVAGVLLGLSLASPEYIPGLFSASDKVGLLLFGVVWGLLGGDLLEETGWTGFAIPNLRKRYSILATGLIVGIIWGIWHMLIAVWATPGLAGKTPFDMFVASFLAFYMIGLPAFRVLLVWAYDRTESLPLVMLMHASMSSSTLILQPLAPGMVAVIWNLALSIGLWVVVAVVAKRGQLSGQAQKKRIRD